MSGKKTAVFGIYSTVSSADHATDTLVRSGFSPRWGQSRSDESSSPTRRNGCVWKVLNSDSCRWI